MCEGPSHQGFDSVGGRRDVGGSTLQQCGGMGRGSGKRDPEAGAWAQGGEDAFLDCDSRRGAERKKGESMRATRKSEDQVSLRFLAWATS